MGGPANLFANLPPISFDHTYNNVHYTEHWLISIFMITSLGFAAGGHQRFYSVKNEKHARRVGWTAAALALTVPLVFGIPPLVAKVYWPDLAQVDFFKPFIGKNPQDLVFVGLVFKLLPHGLIGVFIAAMLAATMTTLSTVYNMVSSVISHDIYKGIFRPDLDDKMLLKVGRGVAFTLGLIVMGLAILFVNSTFGIFNLMQAFFTLFNIPVDRADGIRTHLPPRAEVVGRRRHHLGADRRAPPARYLLGWDIGPQVYLALAMTLAIFGTSQWTGALYRKNKLALGAICLAVIAGTGAPSSGTSLSANTLTGTCHSRWSPRRHSASASSRYARMFAKETDEDRRVVAEFFKKLDTPIDVANEVYGAGRKQVSTLPLVGRTIMFMGILVSAAFFTGLNGTEMIAVGVMAGLLITFGGGMWFFGKRSERKEAEEIAALTAHS